MRTGFPYRKMSSFDDRTANRAVANAAATESTLARSLYVRTAETISTNFRPAVSKKRCEKKKKIADTQRRKFRRNFLQTRHVTGVDPPVT